MSSFKEKTVVSNFQSSKSGVKR